MAIVKPNSSIVIAIFATALLIAATVIFAPIIRESVLSTGSDEADDWQQSVAQLMIDPDSAQFRNTKNASTFGYCGEVNGKNTFGGYVGFKEFHAFKERSGDWVMTTDPPLVEIMCK